MAVPEEKLPMYTAPLNAVRLAGKTPLDESLNYDDDEIRLLQVNLESDKDYELVSHVSLRKSKPQYTALSYTWGDQTSQQTIIVNGTRKSVSLNLFKALQEVRIFWNATYARNGKQLALWVDQLCINQENDEEKNHQVAFIRMIYDRAEEVLIWLPITPPFSSFDPADGFPQGYNLQRPRFTDWNAYKSWLVHSLSVPCRNEAYERPPVLIYQQIANGLESNTPNQDPQADKIKAWMEICAILQSPWWRRAWVYQEFIFATRATFLINGYSLPWRDLYEILNGLMSTFDAHTAFWERVRVDIEKSITGWNSKINQSRRRNADIVEREADEGDCCIYCGETCASLNRCCNRWLIYNNNIVRRYSNWSKEILNTDKRERRAPDHDYGGAGCAECVTVVAGVIVWIVGIVLLGAYWIISCAVAGPCFLISYFKWNCDHQRQSTCDRESAKQELEELEQGFAKEWTDPVASQQMVTLHCGRLVEANEAWELTKFFFSSKIDIATAFLPLSRLVRFARNSSCTDSRDKIFAFLGLTDASYGLHASYEKQNTIHKVLIEAVTAIITVEKNINILSLASEDRNVRNDDVRSLPSWVPWLCKPDDRTSEYNRFLRDVKFPSELCKASKDQACIVSFLSERGDESKVILKARGIRLDTLSRVIEDPPRQVWRKFDGHTVFQFVTRHTARPGDEIWVLFGLDTPVALSRPSRRDNFYTVIGPAMVQEDGQMSDVMTGSLIDKLEQGQVSAEDICIL